MKYILFKAKILFVVFAFFGGIALIASPKEIDFDYEENGYISEDFYFDFGFNRKDLEEAQSYYSKIDSAKLGILGVEARASRFLSIKLARTEKRFELLSIELEVVENDLCYWVVSYRVRVEQGTVDAQVVIFSDGTIPEPIKTDKYQK